MTTLFRKYLHRKESAPYKHDEERGEWASKLDFYLASFGNEIGFRYFGLFPILLHTSGASLFITCIISLFWTTIPIFFIQSALGQFSSSGVLSVFRISPLFKGIGYAILIFNISSVTYLSVMATYPLLYFLKSFSAELPWLTCNNTWNTENCSETFNFTETYYLPANETMNTLRTSAPMEYFSLNVLKDDYNNYYVVSWDVFGCNLLLWICVFGCLVYGIKSVGRTTRVTIMIAFGLLILIFLRVVFLPGSMSGIKNRIFTQRNHHHFSLGSWIMAPAINILFLRTGWGTSLTIASYNNFKANTIKYSIIIPLVLLLLVILGSILINSIFGYLENQNMVVSNFRNLDMEVPFVIMAYGFSLLETPNLWCILFFFMLFLLELNSIVLQVFALLTAIFDEYIWTRPYKKRITLGTCFALFLGSIMYTTVDAIGGTQAFSNAAVANHVFIYFLEFMIVLWIYGRERFQRDLYFMLNQTLATWQIFFIRFTTPIVLLLMTIGFWSTVHMFASYDNPVNITLLIYMKIFPIFIIPGYVVFKLCTSSGSLIERFKINVKPTEWYPAGHSTRIRYDDAQCSSDTSHQLFQVNDSQK